MTVEPYELDLSKPMNIRAVMAREGVTDAALCAYWSPDVDGMVHPLADPDVQAAVKVFMMKLWNACLVAEKP